ncbi:hypothetical protein GW17_00026299 [Ensete ventricosum]|nr:hypothetical protein GW17_00026299 [Ensete ventricosum]
MDVKAHLGLVQNNIGSFDIVYVGSGVIIAFLLKKQESRSQNLGSRRGTDGKMGAQKDSSSWVRSKAGNPWRGFRRSNSDEREPKSSVGD